MSLLALQFLLLFFTGWLGEGSSDRSLSLITSPSFPSDNDYSLVSAVEDNDLETVQEYAACRCADFKQDDIFFYPGVEYDTGTLLHVASSNNNTKIATILLEAGVNVSAYTTYGGLQAIHFAANRGNTQLVELLLEYGADPDAVAETELALAPLHYAVYEPSVAEVLLNAGANIEQPSAEQETPLIYAFYFGSLSTLRTLLEAGADIEPPGFTLEQMRDFICGCKKDGGCRQFLCNREDFAIATNLFEKYAEANSYAKSLKEAPTEEQIPVEEEIPTEEQAPIEEQTPVEEEVPAEEEAPNPTPLETLTNVLENLGSD